MSLPNPELRRRVIGIYKELLHLGKDYPLGYSYFRPRLHRAFMANAQLKSEADIEKGIERAEFVRKGELRGFVQNRNLSICLSICLQVSPCHLSVLVCVLSPDLRLRD